jgi:hypothetical protein
MIRVASLSGSGVWAFEFEVVWLGGVGGAASLPPCPPWLTRLPERSRAEGAAE